MLTPTPEQQAILNAMRETKDNLLVNALAGAAKTSTLVMIAQATPDIPTLCIAFNKRIADEMSERMPPHVKCMTLNSLGHRAWGTAIGKRLVVDSKKVFDLVASCPAYTELSREEKDDFDFGDMLRIVRLAKANGVLPEDHAPHLRPAVAWSNFLEGLDEEPTVLQQRILAHCLRESITLAYKGTIDFDDQIYMPTLFGATFPSYPLIMVDEAQDLSPLNHRMLDKLVRGRLVAVGDPHQAIYAFRGADSASMPRLRDRFSMRELTLSITFRCPKVLVRRAQAHVSSFTASADAIEGELSRLGGWSVRDIEEFSAVICRNNAPLFKLAIELIKAGRGCTMAGADIGPGLVKIMKKLGEGDMPREEAIKALDAWKEEKLVKAKSTASIHDRYDCIHIFLEIGATLAEAIAHANAVFSTRGNIQLMSGHKAKGLEFDSVYHLDEWRIPSKFAETDAELNQEANIRYVIETRAKRKLTLINLSRCLDIHPEQELSHAE